MRPVIALVMLSLPTAAFAGGWEHITTEDRVVISQKTAPGRQIPIFRGVTVIPASLYEVLAVLNDAPRRCSWMHKCMTNREIEKTDAMHTIVYTRTDAPWPVSDRDSVVKTAVEVVSPNMVILATFHTIWDPRVPPVDDAVRMPRLQGHYKLVRMGKARTQVEYMIDADPGGSLPKWLARRAARQIPLNTLRNLRAQVLRTRGRYEAFLDKWDPARQPPPPAPASVPATPTPLLAAPPVSPLIDGVRP